MSLYRKKINEKNKTSEKKGLEMTSTPLRHALLGVTIWGNTATGKACFPC